MANPALSEITSGPLTERIARMVCPEAWGYEGWEDQDGKPAQPTIEHRYKQSQAITRAVEIIKTLLDVGEKDVRKSMITDETEQWFKVLGESVDKSALHHDVAKKWAPRANGKSPRHDPRTSHPSRARTATRTAGGGGDEPGRVQKEPGPEAPDQD